jgi:hypothetical protein
MVVASRRVVPALVVLLVIFASQAAYAADAFERANGHCAAAAPPPDERCPLPLWLPCCDAQAAVGTGITGPIGAGPLALPLEAASAPMLASGLGPDARRAEIPPEPPSRLSTVLRI